MTEPYRVVFVCLGNICRSPTAEGIMTALVDDAGLANRVEIDSAGTAGYHVGGSPDARSMAEAAARGIDLSGQRSRRFHVGDFAYFDLVVAMDHANEADLVDLAPDEPAASKVRLLRSYDPVAAAAHDLDVPDPYHLGADGFAAVFDLIDAGCRGLFAELPLD